MGRLSLSVLIYTIPAVLLALSVHEFSHAFVAYRLGDYSQKQRGRLTLNPLKHLDPFGTVMLIFFGFGWAKPVQINAENYHNAKSGMAWTAFAGPISNLLMAFISMAIYLPLLMNNLGTTYILEFLFYFIQINVGLGLFNLLPIPPLDGSKILLSIFPEKIYFKIMQYEQIIALALMVMLYFGVLNEPLFAARSALLDAFQNVILFFIQLVS